jgi:hypothetical protein
MKRQIFIASVLLLGILSPSPAKADQYAFLTVSLDTSFAKNGVYEYYGVIWQGSGGQVLNPITSRPTDGVFRFTVPISKDSWSLGLSVLQPGAEKDNLAYAGGYPIKSNVGVTSLRSYGLMINGDRTINLNVPTPVRKIDLRVVDASGNNVPNSYTSVSQVGSISLESGGLNWELSSSVHANGNISKSPDGNFSYLYYSGSSIQISAWDNSAANRVTLNNEIKIDQYSSASVCLPLNFPLQSRSFGSDCIQTVIADKIAAQVATSQKSLAERQKITNDFQAKYTQLLQIAAGLNALLDPSQPNYLDHLKYFDLHKEQLISLKRATDFPGMTRTGGPNQSDLDALSALLTGQGSDIGITAMWNLTTQGITSYDSAINVAKEALTHTLVCVKGKLVKKVVMRYPKCPVGYKAKK